MDASTLHIPAEKEKYTHFRKKVKISEKKNEYMKRI